MNRVLDALHMTCKDTSPILSEMVDHEVSLGKRVRAKIHLMMCVVCRYYEVQLLTLQKLAQQLAREDLAALDQATLKPETKEKIKQKLRSP
ncbi:MAG: hypothetical protein COV67_12515 [Nitrospinae bacterium CG11_big_fil_rev_8_21_14_0_20_56_8]|nr:MAG: hypothetical protein COV67_12515 [Nitrospinae bacterium CG11_big_fil_rev_8_21_14_0_20_56_8]